MDQTLVCEKESYLLPFCKIESECLSSISFPVLAINILKIILKMQYIKKCNFPGKTLHWEVNYKWKTGILQKLFVNPIQISLLASISYLYRERIHDVRNINIFKAVN